MKYAALSNNKTYQVEEAIAQESTQFETTDTHFSELLPEAQEHLHLQQMSTLKCSLLRYTFKWEAIVLDGFCTLVNLI